MGSPSPLRFDRINSQVVLRRARSVLTAYLEQCPGGAEPCGVVLSGAAGGRVVFETPVLLPEEQFVPLEMVHGRFSRQRPARLRMPRLR